MTDIQKTNLLWLAMAMTAPQSVNDRYYYDAITELFFYTKQVGAEIVGLYSFLDYPLSEREYKDISVRIEPVNNEVCGIIEIPRLTIEEKIAIQLDFLSNRGGIYHPEELIIAVKNQKDDYRMILDTVLTENSSNAPILSQWEEFKLKAIFQYIRHFNSSIGLALSLE